MRLYLAGPMTGYELWNFPAFDEAAARLRAAGHVVISPADLDRAEGFDERTVVDLPAGFMPSAVRRDIEALLKVEAVALLPGWERSSGTALELKVARALGLDVYTLARVYHDRDLDRGYEPDYWTALHPLSAEAEVEAVERARVAHNAGAEGVLEVDPDAVDIERRLAAYVDADLRDFEMLRGKYAPVVAETITAEAERLVLGNRRDDYGHPADDFARTGRMWAAILGIEDVTPREVGLCMAALKISRHVHRPKRDNLVDLAGYALTVALCDERAEATA